MTRLLHALALAALILLSLDARLAGVRADDLADCQEGSGDTAIRGCSRIIKSRRLYGKPISEKGLTVAYGNRGLAYFKKGQYDRAIADYDTALKLNPKNAIVYYNRGSTYGKKGQYDRAIADYGAAIKLNPKYAAAYNNRAWTYFKWGKATKGLPDANRALELKPDYANALDTRAHIHEAMGNRDSAIADYRKALALDLSIKGSQDGLKLLGVTP